MKLILGDCNNEMGILAEKSIDLLFTDLPYGTTNCNWDCPIDAAIFETASKRLKE